VTRAWHFYPVALAWLGLTGYPAIAQQDAPPEPAIAESEKNRNSKDPSASRNWLGLEAAPLDEPLVTDRPDFTESSVTVPFGRTQLESGYTYTYDSGDGVRTEDHTYPEALLRIGLVEDVELRLGWAGWSHSQESFRERNDVGRSVQVTEPDDGGNDMTAGFKLHFLDQVGLVPDMGVIVDLSLPTGASGQTSGDVDPGIKLLWSYDLTDAVAVAGNVNMAVPTSDDGRFFQTSASLSMGCSITDRLGGYVEYYGFYPNDRGQSDAHYANGGFTYLITDNFQVDIRAGLGLNDEADDFFTGVGFAYRF